ncbi:MAG: protein-methionine-sulfoxide reductase catalytic subunit MsrP [Bryobacter sp.]|nr:protein-methionine-sulfoxide reductase catalytic subunit MsrP [Bryobacter sp.]
MYIRIPKGWELPAGSITPEKHYWGRRELLLAAGFSGVLASAPRNERYKLDRSLTPEWAAKSYNNFYEYTIEKNRVKDLVGDFQPRPWTVEIKGEVAKPLKFSIEDLEAQMPIEERTYRHRCVEAWAMAVPWMGFPLAHLLKMAEPTSKARWVRFEGVSRPKEMPGVRYSGTYDWPYHEALRLDEAMNELAFLVTGLYGKPLPKQNGAPLRLVTPWKYGFKSIKLIAKIELVKDRPATFWNTAVPEEYGFYSNVNPKRPHPRWSQAVEQVLPNMDRVATLPYNGYGEFVAHMYKGNEI